MNDRDDIATSGGSAEPLTPAQRIRADWKALLAKASYLSIASNIPYLAFLALIAVIYIANSHRAVEMQGELNRANDSLKQLRWHSMDIKTKLMNAGMETEIIRKGAVLGLKPLTLPAYSIFIDSNKIGTHLKQAH